MLGIFIPVFLIGQSGTTITYRDDNAQEKDLDQILTYQKLFNGKHFYEGDQVSVYWNANAKRWEIYDFDEDVIFYSRVATPKNPPSLNSGKWQKVGRFNLLIFSGSGTTRNVDCKTLSQLKTPPLDWYKNFDSESIEDSAYDCCTCENIKLLQVDSKSYNDNTSQWSQNIIYNYKTSNSYENITIPTLEFKSDLLGNYRSDNVNFYFNYPKEFAYLTIPNEEYGAPCRVRVKTSYPNLNPYIAGNEERIWQLYHTPTYWDWGNNHKLGTKGTWNVISISPIINDRRLREGSGYLTWEVQEYSSSRSTRKWKTCGTINLTIEDLKYRGRKRIRIYNESAETIKVYLAYRTLFTSGEWKWVNKDFSNYWEIPPRTNYTLTHGENNNGDPWTINADRICIWGKSGNYIWRGNKKTEVIVMGEGEPSDGVVGEYKFTFR